MHLKLGLLFFLGCFQHDSSHEEDCKLLKEFPAVYYNKYIIVHVHLLFHHTVKIPPVKVKRLRILSGKLIMSLWLNRKVNSEWNSLVLCNFSKKLRLA